MTDRDTTYRLRRQELSTRANELRDGIANIEQSLRRLQWMADTERSLRALLKRAAEFGTGERAFTDDQLEAWAEQAWTRAHPEDPT